MPARKPATRSRSSTPPGRTKKAARRAAGGTTTGCSYTQSWSPLTNTRGYVQVWVREEHYEKVAKRLLKKTKDPYVRTLLRQKLAPLGVDWKCTGTCEGGWCQEHMVSENVFVCECAYFV
jgi:hypothetical protein